jgi:hypothetical protein
LFAARWSPPARVLAGIALALCGASGVVAQPTALAHGGPRPIVRYAANESGGRISIAHAGADSTAIEAIRQEMLEAAAAIRRGDFARVRIVRAELPAIRVLSNRSRSLRCIFRPTPRGGELVLLSDDDDVVTAIHQLLAGEPPPARL